MVWGQLNATWPTIVEVRESNFVLCATLVAHHYLVDVVELVPVLIILILVPVEWFKLGAAWYRHV